MKCVCVSCGSVFEKSGKNIVKYCSPACKQKAQNDKIRSTNCIVCGRLFSFKGYHKVRFCSRDCVNRAKSEVKSNPNGALALELGWKTKTNTYERVCIDCGAKIITHSAKTVNRRCADCLAKYRKEFYLKGSSASAKVIDALVDELDIEYIVSEAQPQKGDSQSTQDRQTRAEHNAAANRRRRELRAKRKVLGLPERNVSVNLYRSKALSSTASPECAVCGYSLDVNGLAVHHMDMDRHNNSDSNLRILCCNCHQILHTAIRKHLTSKPTADTAEKVSICMLEFDRMIERYAELKLRN